MKYNFEQKRNDYQTPPELYNKALMLMGLDEFDLDVCCSTANIPAKFHFIEGFADGLLWDWEHYNWCNPPFNECVKWIKKAYNEQQKGNNTIMLLPVRTETKYWHDYILFNQNVTIYWLKKGTRFIDPDTQKEMDVFKNALALIYFKGNIT